MRIKVSERQFQQSIMDLAKMYGWIFYHTHDSRRSEPGFPDLVFLKPPRLLFVELKTNEGELSEWQKTWIDALKASGIDARVWRPSDWTEIERTLANRTELP